MTKVRWRAHKRLRLLAGADDRVSAADRDAYAAKNLPWLIVMAGDKRQDPKIDLVVMPAEQAFDLIASAIKEAE